ncbi:predicted protein [Coccidioides posadasii str. Silveira]|uniref:Predicted protein n=1 Tax=Coccidioides posadasii (strain RMSCC 757 / Silveira) TaxID=443226 RepID=E9D9J6_COCPS|nr:predicted protein [Coccidioides posadasii str. Silveira]
MSGMKRKDAGDAVVCQEQRSQNDFWGWLPSNIFPQKSRLSPTKRSPMVRAECKIDVDQSGRRGA